MDSEKSNYTIKDEDINCESICSVFSTSKPFKNPTINEKLIHKYFIYSIFSVKKPESQYALLQSLHQSLLKGGYYISILDVDNLYHVLFKELPNYENLRKNSANTKLLFMCMHIFMEIFYNSSFQYFFNIDNDGSLFSYNTSFIFDYLLSFQFEKMNKKTDDYLILLQNDGSLTNIMNFLFTYFINGIEYKRISKFMFRLFENIDSDFVQHYFDKKNFLSKSSAILINHRKKLILMTHYQIHFFIKFLKQNNNMEFKDLAYQTFSEEEKEKIVENVNFLQIYDFLESFLFNYTEQLISEGRLKNNSNPFKADQKESQIKSYKFYPEKADDQMLNDVFSFVCELILVFTVNQMSEITLQFFPLFLSTYKIVPGIMLDRFERGAYELFQYIKKLDSTKYENLKNIFCDVINDRFSDNYIPDIEAIAHMFNHENTETIKNILIIDYFKVLFLITSPNYDEVFKSLHFGDDVDKISKLFVILGDIGSYYLYNYEKVFLSLLNYYKNYATNPKIMTNYVKIYIKIKKKRFYRNEISEPVQKIMDSILMEKTVDEIIKL